MNPFQRRSRVRPLPYPAPFYRAELRRARWQMWTSRQLLRIELDWALRYVVRLIVLCWLGCCSTWLSRPRSSLPARPVPTRPDFCPPTRRFVYA
ncbi:hypothetical protein GAS19_29540 (plasmid) [Burkholderia glumae]|nr:hypothetical protein GAS19_29540 [Burkholderia glumae]